MEQISDETKITDRIKDRIEGYLAYRGRLIRIESIVREGETDNYLALYPAILPNQGNFKYELAVAARAASVKFSYGPTSTTIHLEGVYR
jgi:hypothetical protein